jgi:hypothetical protein
MLRRYPPGPIPSRPFYNRHETSSSIIVVSSPLDLRRCSFPIEGNAAVLVDLHRRHCFVDLRRRRVVSYSLLPPPRSPFPHRRPPPLLQYKVRPVFLNCTWTGPEDEREQDNRGNCQRRPVDHLRRCGGAAPRPRRCCGG